MTDLLLRLFVREPGSPEAHGAVGRLAGSTGIVCNLLLAAGKLAAGLITGSVAIIGDGINNLTDSASSVVTLLGFRLAQRPADREHPFGHGRYEYISGLAVAALVLVAGVELAKSSLIKILHPVSLPFTVVTPVLLLLSIGVKFWMAGFYRKLGDRIRSRTLAAAAQDSRNDCIATSAVLLSAAADWLLQIPLDGWAGMGVAAFILYSGAGLLKETVSPILGTRADGMQVQALTELLLAHPGVLGIHDLMIHDYGPGRCYATVHAEMDASEDPLDAHDCLDHIEQEALRRLGIHLVIHFDPVADWGEYRAAAQAAANRFPGTAIHDLRVVNYHQEPRLSFDLEVPYDYPACDADLAAGMQAALAAEGCTLPAEIRIDRGK